MNKNNYEKKRNIEKFTKNIAQWNFNIYNMYIFVLRVLIINTGG